MLLEGVLLFVLLWLYARKPRFRGQVAGFFVAGYGVFRFVAEFWRRPDANLGLLGLGLSMGRVVVGPDDPGGPRALDLRPEARPERCRGRCG